LLLSLREFSGDEDDETEVAQAAARLWPRIVGSLGEFRVDLLAVTAAAEQENDLAGEEAAVAAFRRSSGASVHSLPRITSSGTPVASSALANRRRATRALAAALTAVAVAGAGGVAAATDALPVPVSGSQSHRVSTRPSSEADLLNTARTRGEDDRERGALPLEPIEQGEPVQACAGDDDVERHLSEAPQPLLDARAPLADVLLRRERASQRIAGGQVIHYQHARYEHRGSSRWGNGG